jgi:predicted nucleotidyltransferase
MKTLQPSSTNATLREILGKLQGCFQDLYGNQLFELVLYGSQARGDARSDSDIDVLVVLDRAVNPGDEIARTGEIMAKLSLEYGVVISCVFVSAERYSTEQSPLLLNVRRDGVGF